MTDEQRKAVAWAIDLLDGFFALTGMEPKPESRSNMKILREMVKENSRSRKHGGI